MEPKSPGAVILVASLKLSGVGLLRILNSGGFCHIFLRLPFAFPAPVAIINRPTRRAIVAGRVFFVPKFGVMKKSCPKCGSLVNLDAETCPQAGCGVVFKKARQNLILPDSDKDDVASRDTVDSTKVRVDPKRLPPSYRRRLSFGQRVVAVLTWPFRLVGGLFSRDSASRHAESSTQFPDAAASAARPAAKLDSPSQRSGSRSPAAPAGAGQPPGRIGASVPSPESAREFKPVVAVGPHVPSASPASDPSSAGTRPHVGEKKMANEPKPAEPRRVDPDPASVPAKPQLAAQPDELAAQFAAAARRGDPVIVPPGGPERPVVAAKPAVPPAAAPAPVAPAPAPVAAAPPRVKQVDVSTVNVLPPDPTNEPPPHAPSMQSADTLGPSLAPTASRIDTPIGEARVPAAAAARPDEIPPTRTPISAPSVTAAGAATIFMDDETPDPRSQQPARTPATPSAPRPAAQVSIGQMSVAADVGKPLPPPSPPVATRQGTGLSGMPPDKGASSPKDPQQVNIRETAYFGAMPTRPRVEQKSHFLDVLDTAGIWSTLIEIGPQGVTIGRTKGNVTLNEVTTMGACHARFCFENGVTTVTDLGSRNGVLLRIREPVRLRDEQRFRVGTHLLAVRRFVRGEPKQQTLGPDPDEVLCTREIAPHAQLSFVAVDGGELFSYPLLKTEYVIGRDPEQTDIPLAGDSASSRRHAKLRFDGQNHWLEDLGSQNGTYVQITGQERLNVGDMVLLGLVLFRISEKSTEK